MSTNKTKLAALLKLINSAAQEAIAEYEKAGGDVPSIDSTELHPLDTNVIDQVALKTAVRTLEGACAQLCTTLAPPSHTAINVRPGYPFPILSCQCHHLTPLARASIRLCLCPCRSPREHH